MSFSENKITSTSVIHREEIELKKESKPIVENSLRNETDENIIGSNNDKKIIIDDLITVKSLSQEELNSIPKNRFLKSLKAVIINSSNFEDIKFRKSVTNEDYSEQKNCIQLLDKKNSIYINNKELYTKKGKSNSFFMDFYVLQKEENSIKINLKWKQKGEEGVSNTELTIPKLENETKNKKWYYFCVNLGKLDREEKSFNMQKKLGNDNKKELLYHKFELEIENLIDSNSESNKIFITPPKLYTIEKRAWYNQKKNSIIFFDIENLTTELLEKDSLLLPNLYYLSRHGNYFRDCSSNSLDRNLAITSYLTGFYPSELYYKEERVEKNDFSFEEEKISKALRDITFPDLYRNNSYDTYHISNIKGINSSFGLFQDLGLNNISVFNSNSSIEKEIIHSFELLESKLNMSITMKKEEAFFHIVLPSKTTEQLQIIDNLIGKIIEKYASSNNSFIFTSSHQSDHHLTEERFRIKQKPAIFYNKKGIKKNISDNKVDLFDIIKTTLAYSSLSFPYHYPGTNLLKSKKNNRDFIFRENNKFSKSIESEKFYYSYSSDEYGSFSEKLWNKEGNENFYQINTPNKNIYKQILTDFRLKTQVKRASDFVKKLTLNNNTDSLKDFSIEVISKQKFITFDKLKDYYKLKRNRRKNRYIEKIIVSVKPNESKQISIFFRKRDQMFHFKFKEKQKIGYGENWIYAGEKKKFDEESQLGLFNNLALTKNIKLSTNIDVHIMNYEIK